MIETIILLAVLGGGGFTLFKDYKSGFAITGPALYKLSGGRIKLKITKEDRLLLVAERGVENMQKNVHVLRESLAEIQANRDMALKTRAEQSKLAADFGAILNEIINNPDKQDEAHVAAVAKVEAKKRADLFAQLAKEQTNILAPLQRELDSAEMRLDEARTKASTIKVFVTVTVSRKSLYSLNSNVGADGATPKGEIDEALHEAEKEMIKSAAMLEMAHRSNGNRGRLLLGSVEVDNEMNAARQRMALPPVSDSRPQIQEVLDVEPSAEKSRDEEDEITTEEGV